LPACGDLEVNPGPPRVPARSAPCSNHSAPPEFLLKMATGRLEPLDPAVEGPDKRPRRWWEVGNGWPVWRCTRCLHTLPAAGGERGVEAHLLSCHLPPTQEEIRMTHSVLGPDALPPQPHPVPPQNHPVPTGRGSLATCGDVEPNPGPPTVGVPARMFLPLDTALLAPDIHVTLTLHPATGPARPRPLVVRAVWDVMAGSASHAHLPRRVCPMGWHAPTGAP